MSNPRKLQGEIDRLLKKVEEGGQAFDQIIQKVYSSTNPNQKEKHEQDLKKEIKKLQRARDQIKIWIQSSEVKQKTLLIEARKNIETKMEQFKSCEKDSKTKAFSKEGLMQQDRENDQKSETRNWIRKSLKELSNQMDQYELEIEQIPKKKQANNPRVQQLQEYREKHKYYSNQLEKVLKKYENEQLSTDDILSIKYPIDCYIETLLEDDTIFDNLGLDDTNLGELGSWEGGTQPTNETESEYEDETSSKNSTNSSKASGITTPVINSLLRNSSDLKKKDLKPKEKKEEKEKKENPEDKEKKENDTTTEKKKLPAEPHKPQPPNYQMVARSLAANAPAPKPTTAAIVKKSVERESSTPSSPNLSHHSSHLKESQSLNSSENSDDDLNSETFGGSTSDMPTGSLQELSQSTHEKLIEVEKKVPAAVISGPAKMPTGVNTNNTVAQPVPEPKNFQGSASGIADVLQTSMKNLPEGVPVPKPRGYTPKNGVKTPPYYPQQPSTTFENPEIFSKFDTDTLFFIFYNQQGTYQQYLAAKELKRLNWRYHKKYLTWFQRHEDPKRIFPDYETGTYVYFDYETGWCQRRKTEFTFEYRFLEDFD